MYAVPSMHSLFYLPDKVKSLLPLSDWTSGVWCDNLSIRSSPLASDTKRQIVMDDKIFESARMTAALDDDQGAYEAFLPSISLTQGLKHQGQQTQLP